MLNALLVIIALSFAHLAQAQSERWFQEHHCPAEIEHILEDRTRVDCLTDTHAIEYDFAHKWAEAIGQALHYSLMTGKRGGVVLILRKKSERKHWRRLNKIIEEHQLPIDSWAIEAWRLN